MFGRRTDRAGPVPAQGDRRARPGEHVAPGSFLLATTAASSGWLGTFLLDLVAGRRQHVPLGAERLDALAVGVAGLAVTGEVVQRVAVVGDLGLAVGPGGGPQQRRGNASPSPWRPVGGVGRPAAGAGAIAGGAGALVLLEQVQRAAGAVHQNGPELGALDRDRRATGRSRRRAGRGAAAAGGALAAAAGGDHGDRERGASDGEPSSHRASLGIGGGPSGGKPASASTDSRPIRPTEQALTVGDSGELGTGPPGQPAIPRQPTDGQAIVCWPVALAVEGRSAQDGEPAQG